MKTRISAVLALCAVSALAACGSAPTASEAVPPGAWQADAVPTDTTGRVPNLFDSGN